LLLKILFFVEILCVFLDNMYVIDYTARCCSTKVLPSLCFVGRQFETETAFDLGLKREPFPASFVI